MLREVGLTPFQRDFASYRVLNVLSTLEPEKDECTLGSINAQLGTMHSLIPKALKKAFCIGREKDGNEQYLHRKFEASLGACGGCPVIGIRGAGCIIYDARARPDKFTATPEARKERGLKY